MRFSGAILLFIMCLIRAIIPSTSVQCYVGCSEVNPGCMNGYYSTNCSLFKYCTSGPSPDYFACLDPGYMEFCDGDPSCDKCDYDCCNDPSKYTKKTEN